LDKRNPQGESHLIYGYRLPATGHRLTVIVFQWRATWIVTRHHILHRLQR